MSKICSKDENISVIPRNGLNDDVSTRRKHTFELCSSIALIAQLHYLGAFFEGTFPDNSFPLRVQSEKFGNVEVFSNSRKISSQKVSDKSDCCISQLVLLLHVEDSCADPSRGPPSKLRVSSRSSVFSSMFKQFFRSHNAGLRVPSNSAITVVKRS